MAVLPEGFEIEAAPSRATLPAGFQVEQQPPQLDLESFNPSGEIGQAPQIEQGPEPTALNLAKEAGSSLQRNLAGIADFVGPDTFDAISKLVGSDVRSPKFKSLTQPKGFFAGEGLATDIVSGAVDAATLATGVGGATRLAAKALPAIAAGESTAIGVARQLGGTAAQDVTLGAASGAGGAIGQEQGGDTGALVGAVLAPVGGVGAQIALTKLISSGRTGIQALLKSTEGMSEDGASTLLAEAMVREGLSPDDATKILADLGPEALPADIGSNFARLLRTASNKIPRIEGRAGEVFKARQSGQGDRVSTAFDDASGTASLNVDDEIIRLNNAQGPKITQAYNAAREAGEIALAPKKELPVGVGAAKGRVKPAADKALPADIPEAKGKFAGLGFGGTTGGLKQPVTPKGTSKPSRLTETVKPQKTRLQALLDDENVTGVAKKAADLELTAKRLSGETVTKLDIIDANKRALDDVIIASIRKGKKNKSRSLVKLKNIIVNEVDKLLPEYKAARSLFAGKAALEDSAEAGGLFLKMKVGDVKNLTQVYGESEKRMFKLGAKKAIIEKVDDIATNRNTVQALFGKNGDTQKLKHLFDDDKSFKAFEDTLKRETEFVMTRRAAQGNSSTVQQAADQLDSASVLSNAAQATTSTVGAASVLGRILGGLASKKSDVAFTKALEEVGDILLSKGMDPAKLQALLRRGNAKNIEAVFRNAIKKDLTSPRVAPITAGTAESQREN